MQNRAVQPRSRRPRIALVPLILVVAAGLAGCAAGPTYSDLDRAATQSDVLPADVSTPAAENMEPETVRFVGEKSGVQFYLSRAKEGGACLVAYRGVEPWVAGCGVDLKVGGQGLTARVVPDESELETGWTSIGHNVHAIGLPE